MRFFVIAAEQLDLAAELLRESHPTPSRLALILVDNALECSLHRYAHDHFLLNPVPSHLSVTDRRQEYRKRAGVIGRHLKPKIAFALEKAAMTDDQASFVRNAHEFRNQAYHTGLTHDPIITELATAYYSVFCQLFPGLTPHMTTAGIDDSYTPRATRHMDGIHRLAPDRRAAELVARSLLQALPQQDRSLPAACQQALGSELARIRTDIDYLVRNEPNVGNAQNLILTTQFWHAFWAAGPEEGLTVRVSGSGAEVDADQREDWERALKQMRTAWTPKVSLRTLASWDTRICALDSEAAPGRLLQKYSDLQAQMQPFKKMMSERRGSFDQHVESLLEQQRTPYAGREPQ